jgi:Acyltransferase family.
MTANEGTGKTSKARLLYIDNLRIFLICLVIATHTAITYGGTGGWYYIQSANGTLAPAVLTLLTVLNQAFFMGAFILLSAYFIPGSLLRKGAGKFSRDRLVRLGIPLLVWLVLLEPVLEYIGFSAMGQDLGAFPGYWVSCFTRFPNIMFGPMWFVAFLLFATFAYLLWLRVFPATAPGDSPRTPFPGFTWLLGLGLLLGALTTLVRLVCTIGTMWFFGFQLPFFPQYIAFFILGIVAAQNHWFDAIPQKTGKACAVLALILVVAEPVLVTILSGSPAGLAAVRGGMYWQSVVFAFWEQVAGVMITIGLAWLFSVRLNRQGPVATAMAGDAYTVYIIHPFFVVLLAIALSSLAIPALGKFAIVLPLAIVLSFGVAHLIRAIPGVSRVL